MERAELPMPARHWLSKGRESAIKPMAMLGVVLIVVGIAGKRAPNPD